MKRTIAGRVENLEQTAEQLAYAQTLWGNFWQRLRIVYGDGQRYTAEELDRLDSIDPAAGTRYAVKKIYSGHADSGNTGDRSLV